MKTIFKCMLIAMLGVLAQFTLQAQTKKQTKKDDEAAIVQSVINGRNFAFRAQTMVPMAGITRQLNGFYDLTISDDEVVSFLPYMGRIYTPLIDPTQGPLRFTSKDFTYKADLDAKKGWTISIKPKDVRSVREFTLSVQDDGDATLRVTGNDRQPITFYGYIVETA